MPTFTHGKGTNVFVNGVDLSSYFKDYQYQTKMDTAETSTFGSTVKTYVQGMAESTVSVSGYYNDTSAGSVDTVLSATIGAANDAVILICPTGSTALGARVIAGRAISSDYSVQSAIGSVVEVSGAFQGDGGLRTSVSVNDLTPETVSTTTTSVDTQTTVATSNGGMLSIQVTANTMNAGSAIKIQSSSDNTTFVDVAGGTVTVPTVTTGGYAVSIAKGVTLNQYVRCVSTMAGTGSITYTAAFARF